jgi:hypothetical protein
MTWGQNYRMYMDESYKMDESSASMNFLDDKWKLPDSHNFHVKAHA